jgi:hypothetical protein
LRKVVKKAMRISLPCWIKVILPSRFVLSLSRNKPNPPGFNQEYQKGAKRHKLLGKKFPKKPDLFFLAPKNLKKN